MKKIILGLALLATPAAAADMPLKARPLAQPVGCTINYCVGFYVGAGLSGVANNLNVFANGINGSLNAGGTILDLHAGYRMYNGKFYLGAEVGGGYDVAFGSGPVGGFSDRFSGMEVVKLGGSLAGLLGQQNTFAFPEALQPYFMSFYANVGAKQRMGANGLVGGVGAEFVIGPNSTINLDYFNVQYSGGGVTDTTIAAIPQENLFRLSYNYNF